MNDKIGKHGNSDGETGEKPKCTLLGNPIPNQVTLTRGLGNGYYCVVDVGNIANADELIEELKKEVSHEQPKRKHIARSAISD